MFSFRIIHQHSQSEIDRHCLNCRDYFCLLNYLRKKNEGIIMINDSENRAKDKLNTIDREKTCPFLLRVFSSTARHHQMSEFSRGSLPSNEVQVYTWLDASLKELTSLLREVNPDARRKGTVLEFGAVYPSPRTPNSHILRTIGTTVSGQKSPDDSKSLTECRFQIGDYLDVAVTVPALMSDRGDDGHRMRGGSGAVRSSRGDGGGGRFRKSDSRGADHDSPERSRNAVRVGGGRFGRPY